MLRHALSLALVALTVSASTAFSQDTNTAPASVEAAVSVDALKLQLKPLTQAELEAAANAWQTTLQEITTQISTAEITALDADGEVKSTALATAAKAREEQTRTADRFKVVLDAYVAKGGDDAAYRQYLDAVTGLTVTAKDPNAALKTIQSWVSSKEGGIRWGFNLLKFLIVLFIAKIVAGIACKIARKAVSKAALSDLLKTFITNTTKRVVMILGFIVALSMLEVNVGPLLAGVGVVGFVLGFALQDTLSNFAAGFMILLYRPYDIGDVITAGGVTGKVSSMSLVSTTVLTPDNQIVIVPNGGIWGGVITNITGNDTRRIDMTFGIGYGDDIAKAEQVLTEIIAAHELILKNPEPVIKVHELADSSVNFVVRPWSNTGDYWAVYWDLMRTVKLRFDEEGISIPFPQQDVYMHQAD